MPLDIAEAGQTVITVIFGLAGFGLAIFLIFYLKAFLAKIFGTRHINISGRTTIDPDSFDNLNEFIKEKASSVIGVLKSNEVVAKISSVVNRGEASNKRLTLNASKPATCLDSSSFIQILNQRATLKKEDIGKQCVFTVECITRDVPFVDKIGNQVFDIRSPYQEVRKKYVYCISNSAVEMKKQQMRDLLNQAMQYEREGRLAGADNLFRDYLDKVRFKFSLLSSNRIFDLIKPGDDIDGIVEYFENERTHFLTLNSDSVRFTKTPPSSSTNTHPPK